PSARRRGGPAARSCRGTDAPRSAAASDDPAGTAALGLERQARALPRRHAALEVLDRVPERAEAAGRGVAPVPVTAHREDRPALRHLAAPGAELTERDVLRPGDVSGLPLIRLAHVERVQVGPALRILRRHGEDSAAGDLGSRGPPYCEEDRDHACKGRTSRAPAVSRGARAAPAAVPPAPSRESRFPAPGDGEARPRPAGVFL